MRLLVVTESSDILRAADSLTDRLNDFVRERAEYGRGNIPDESVGGFLDAERDFAERAKAGLRDRPPS